MAWFVVRRDLDSRLLQYFSETPPHDSGVWLDSIAGALATDEQNARAVATTFNDILRNGKFGCQGFICLAQEVELAGDL